MISGDRAFSTPLPLAILYVSTGCRVACGFAWFVVRTEKPYP